LRIALRARGRRRDHEEFAPEHEPLAADSSARDQLEPRERDRAVAESLARLPPEQRSVLSLFAIEELSHKQIAEILGVPEGTVWSRLHTARKRLAAEHLGRSTAHKDRAAGRSV
jgi:RNA polymerase sigma-70 factor (ECF subfamily)